MIILKILGWCLLGAVAMVAFTFVGLLAAAYPFQAAVLFLLLVIAIK